MKKNKTNILITGGAGFIGSYIVKLFLKKNFSVINIDKLTYASNRKNLKDIEKLKNYKFIKADITNFHKLKNIIKKYKPQYIINCAAETHVDRSINSSLPFIKSNIIGTYNLLECVREIFCENNRLNKFKLFHQVSTDEVFGDSFNLKLPPNENSNYNPSSPYSASKASSDNLVIAWGRTFKIPYSISICTNNYGPYQFPEKLIPKTILNALNGKEIPIYGDGKQVRDWLFAKDHALAIEKIILNSKSIGNKFNISGNNNLSNLNLVKFICNQLDKKIKKKPRNIKSFRKLIRFVNDRPGHDRKYFLNSKKIYKFYRWLPSKNIKEGLNITLNWYLTNIKWWRNKNL